MAAICDVKCLLEQFHTEESEENIENVDLGFACQYNLLRGFKMEISGMERKKLSKWKEMAISTEKKLAKRKNERDKHIRESVNKVALQLENNRLQTMNNGNSVVAAENNQTFNVNPQNHHHEETLPYAINHNNDSINHNNDSNNVESSETSTSTVGTENRVRPDSLSVNKTHESFENNINGVDNIPALRKHMESLQTLQARQKELDEWYETMQKQLDLEKMRLTAKYEEMYLKNIREQQSIIDSSQEFLRCASNNNTPGLPNANNNTPGLPNANYSANYKQTSEKSQLTPLLGAFNENMSTSKTSPLVQTNSLSSTAKQTLPGNVARSFIGNDIKPDIEDERRTVVENEKNTVVENEKRTVVENEIKPTNVSECFTSNKKSMEYNTPSPDKNSNIAKECEIVPSAQAAGTPTKQSTSTKLSCFSDNIVNNSTECNRRYMSNSNSDNIVNNSTESNRNNSTESNRRYMSKSNSEMNNNSATVASLACVQNDFLTTNSDRNTSNTKHSIRTSSSVESERREITSLESERREIKHNSFLKESCHSSQTKTPVEIPDELKTVISVPPRRKSSSEMSNPLEMGDNSVEKLMKKPFNELKVRRKSRPVKFFNDPFPPADLLSSHEFDDDVAAMKSGHLTLHSPVGLPLNKGQLIEKNPIGSNEVGSSPAVSSPVRNVMSPASTISHSFTRQQQHLQQQQQQHLSDSYRPRTPDSYRPRTPDKVITTTGTQPQPSDNHQGNVTVSSLLSARPANSLVGPAGLGLLTTPTAVANCSTSTSSNFQRACSTSTPQQIQAKAEEGFVLEISAVASQQNNDMTSKSIVPQFPLPKGAAKLYAVAKGFLTRRLYNTIKVQEIVKTIKDTEEFLIDINKENIFSQKLADRQLKVRLQDELSTKRAKLHDIFFNMDARDQMKMLAISRVQVEEKNRKKQAQMKPRQHLVRNAGTNKSLSTTTMSQKSARKKPTNNIMDKAPRTKPVSEKLTNSIKKGKKVDTNVENIYVCISGALKPIQSCTSPTMADRKKCKSPGKSVQNRYTKKSNASKRLDMNAALGTPR